MVNNRPFDDLAHFHGSRDEKLSKFRAVRDEIQPAIDAWYRAV